MEGKHMQDTVKKYKQLIKKRAALGHAMGVLSYDSETVMPKNGAPHMAETMATLSEELYRLRVNDELRDMLNELEANKAELDPVTRREVEFELKELKKLERVPVEEYSAFDRLISEASIVWREAKRNSDYQLFKPYMKRIVAASKAMAGYMYPGKPAYDALLEEFSEGLSMDMLEPFFKNVKAKLVPVIHAVCECGRQADDSKLRLPFPIEGQRRLSSFVMDFLGIDKNSCVIGEVEHPFTTAFNKHDIRLTTHYHEEDVLSNLLSVAHEGGHCLYELNIGDELIGSPLASGATMALHESQSRLFENMICRSPEFIALLYPRMKEIFPLQMQDISEELLFRAANRAEPSLIRTEADELTYPLHIMVRYEIEKQLIAGTLSVDDLPEAWNSMYKEYLGVDVPDDKAGVLQDSHWAGGMIGYFPSYCVGSAYSAQIYHNIAKEIDIPATVAQGGVKPIVEWLTDRLYRFGKLKTPEELSRSVLCGEFDPDYYTDYLTKKFTELYKL